LSSSAAGGGSSVHANRRLPKERPSLFGRRFRDGSFLEVIIVPGVLHCWTRQQWHTGHARFVPDSIGSGTQGCVIGSTDFFDGSELFQSRRAPIRVPQKRERQNETAGPALFVSV
jgi:hypothetical protein